MYLFYIYIYVRIPSAADETAFAALLGEITTAAWALEHVPWYPVSHRTICA